MLKYGFVYIWFDKKHHKYYIGRHWGTVDDGYVSSSTNMRNNYKNRPSDFKRRIISYVYTCNEDLVAEEQRWLDMIKLEELNTRYYNKTLRSNCPSHFGFKHTEQARKLISESSKGRQFSEYARRRQRETMIGRKQTSEEKEKRASKLRGLKRSEDVRNKMRGPKPKLLCPHCGKIGGVPGMKRYHFEKCKYK